MRVTGSVLAAAAACAQTVLAQTTLPTHAPLTGSLGNTTIVGNGTAVNSTSGKYTIQAEGITAMFVPYGASISNLFLKDVHGVTRDVVFGWDNATYYTEDPVHGHWGAVPGRYANRIKNSSFTIDGKTYHTEPNENVGVPNAEDTLHGGPAGWDHRNWTIVTHTTDSITFSLVDPDGSEGFPGQVIAYVTYSVSPYTWHIQMTAKSTEQLTPIMLSSHTYWNLDGWQNPSTPTILNHTLYMPFAGQHTEVDGNLIPTGQISYIAPYSVDDFYTAPKQLGANLTGTAALGNCGTNCTGYDTCFIFNRDAAGPYDWQTSGPVATLRSNFSGIQVDVFTDQAAFQVYACNQDNGVTPLKSTQGLSTRPRVLEQYGCVVMEVEDWIDGINNPAWGRLPRQLYGPSDPPYVLQASYQFSTPPLNSSMRILNGDPSTSNYGSANYGSGFQKRGF